MTQPLGTLDITATVGNGAVGSVAALASLTTYSVRMRTTVAAITSIPPGSTRALFFFGDSAAHKARLHMTRYDDGPASLIIVDDAMNGFNFDPALLPSDPDEWIEIAYVRTLSAGEHRWRKYIIRVSTGAVLADHTNGPYFATSEGTGDGSVFFASFPAVFNYPPLHGPWAHFAVFNAELTGVDLYSTPPDTIASRIGCWLLEDAIGSGTAANQKTVGEPLTVTGGTFAGPSAATPAVTSVGVTPTTFSTAVGATQQLTANVVAVNGASTAVAWSSSDTNKATVSSGGLVTVLQTGSVTITATSTFDGTKTGTSTGTLTAAPPTVRPRTGQITPTPKDAALNALGGRSTGYTSANTAVATVDAAGLVTAQGAGTTTVTGNCEGKTSTTTVTVYEGPNS